jgi:hypothetical protein
VTQLLIAASVGLAVLVNQVVVLVAKSVADFYVLLGSLILAAGASACAVLATWLLSLVVGKAVGLGLAGIAFVVALHGLGLIALAMPLPRGSKERVAFVGSGLNILGGFVGAAFVAAVDAGLKLLGA